MKRRDTDEYVTIPEAQRRTGIGRRQFTKALKSGDLGVYDLGSWPRVRWADVLAWIERKRRDAPVASQQ
jgi:excisionase family DNA binding protein